MNKETIRAFIEAEVISYDFLSAERQKEAIEPLFEALSSIYDKLDDNEKIAYIDKMKSHLDSKN